MQRRDVSKVHVRDRAERIIDHHIKISVAGLSHSVLHRTVQNVMLMITSVLIRVPLNREGFGQYADGHPFRTRAKRVAAFFGEERHVVAAIRQILDEMRGVRFHPTGIRWTDRVMQVGQHRNPQGSRRINYVECHGFSGSQFVFAWKNRTLHAEYLSPGGRPDIQ